MDRDVVELVADVVVVDEVLVEVRVVVELVFDVDEVEEAVVVDDEVDVRVVEVAHDPEGQMVSVELETPPATKYKVCIPLLKVTPK